MAIGLVLVTYAHYPEKLIRSIENTGINVQWYIHHHGSEPFFAEKIQRLGEKENFNVYMHCVNRGLSKSWNEGLHQSFQDNCRHSLLLNDDLFFIDDGFAHFIRFIDSSPNYGLAFVHGLETGGSHYSGQVIVQGFACCAVGATALQTIGYFDENIVPAYFEDIDYDRRARIAGVLFVTSDGVLVEHERSKTTRDNPEIAAEHISIMDRNRSYYKMKWGEQGNETKFIPFNDQKFGLEIAWENRSDPYPGIDLNTDHVKIAK